MQKTLIKRELKEKGREIVLRTRGSSHGPITRLVSPSDLGQAISHSYFWTTLISIRNKCRRLAFHPHSGIETVTVVQ
jgi:hypothetical protein